MRACALIGNAPGEQRIPKEGFPQAMSAGYVQDGIGSPRVPVKQLDRTRRGHHLQINVAPACFVLYFWHNRQATGAGTHDEVLALPGDLLLERERRVAKAVAELL